jgi:hypothetical protein
MADYLEAFRAMDAPSPGFERSFLGTDFAEELAVTSRLWFRTGYGQGIAAYLNFFLLKDFIVTHDEAHAPRFATFQSMARSFHRTDLFVREVTDSGREPSGGISNGSVRRMLRGIMVRHERLAIPPWMMTYFGYQLCEAVEQQCEASSAECGMHLRYMAKAFRLMGIPFSDRRELMAGFARAVEEAHAGPSPQLERHARHILVLGEMVGVSSHPARICTMLPAATRAVFLPIAAKVRPGAARRLFSRLAGRMLVPRALGKPRPAVPVEEAG